MKWKNIVSLLYGFWILHFLTTLWLDTVDTQVRRATYQVFRITVHCLWQLRDGLRLLTKLNTLRTPR